MLNFGLAKEQYAAQHPDKADRAKFVIVGDDVAVGKTQGKIVGRRYPRFTSFMHGTRYLHQMQRIGGDGLGL